jgi:hypothetical protein
MDRAGHVKEGNMGMWKSRRVAAGVGLVFGLAAGAPAFGQVVKKGTLSGTLLSGAVTAAAGTTETILTAPSSGFTILLRVCGAKPVGGENPVVAVSGSSLGVLATFGSDATENQGGNGLCADLSPGLVLPPGEVLRCKDVFGTSSASCTAMSVVSRK